jgi:ligand-binding SRPBCC domain-containing protein
MPTFHSSLQLRASAETLFDFLTAPANWPTLAPPDLQMQLLEGPAKLELGAKAAWKVRRWGIAQRIGIVVTKFERNAVIVLEQEHGPFAKWLHSQQITANDNGVVLNEEIDFAPPTGMLGRLVTADATLRDLEVMFAFRREQLAQLGSNF